VQPKSAEIQLSGISHNDVSIIGSFLFGDSFTVRDSASNVPAKADIRNIQKRVQSRTWMLARSERQHCVEWLCRAIGMGRNVGAYSRSNRRKKAASMFD